MAKTEAVTRDEPQIVPKIVQLKTVANTEASPEIADPLPQGRKYIRAQSPTEAR